MLKQTITYTDFDDNETTETLYFNITKSELLENIHLKDELEEMTERLKGDPRTLTTSEVKDILDLVKTFMGLAYGIRSADGKKFTKNEELWIDFKQTAAYDAFLMSLFEDASKAISFLLNIIPKDLRTEAEKSMQGEATVTELPKSNHNPGGTVDLPTAPPVLENETKTEKTDEELLAMKPQDMTPDELRRAYTLKSQQ